MSAAEDEAQAELDLARARASARARTLNPAAAAGAPTTESDLPPQMTLQGLKALGHGAVSAVPVLGSYFPQSPNEAAEYPGMSGIGKILGTAGTGAAMLAGPGLLGEALEGPEIAARLGRVAYSGAVPAALTAASKGTSGWDALRAGLTGAGTGAIAEGLQAALGGNSSGNKFLYGSALPSQPEREALRAANPQMIEPGEIESSGLTGSRRQAQRIQEIGQTMQDQGISDPRLGMFPPTRTTMLQRAEDAQKLFGGRVAQNIADMDRMAQEAAAAGRTEGLISPDELRAKVHEKLKLTPSGTVNGEPVPNPDFAKVEALDRSLGTDPLTPSQAHDWKSKFQNAYNAPAQAGTAPVEAIQRQYQKAMAGALQEALENRASILGGKDFADEYATNKDTYANIQKILPGLSGAVSGTRSAPLTIGTLLGGGAGAFGLGALGASHIAEHPQRSIPPLMAAGAVLGGVRALGGQAIGNALSGSLNPGFAAWLGMQAGKPSDQGASP